MSRAAAIRLPPLDLSVPDPLSAGLKSRARSASIVKVEHVGDRSVEEFVDRAAYSNINADWVNAKGAFYGIFNVVEANLFATRRMDDSCRPHHLW